MQVKLFHLAHRRGTGSWYGMHSVPHASLSVGKNGGTRLSRKGNGIDGARDTVDLVEGFVHLYD